MRPRMYGSTEMYMARARNSPSFSAGIGVSIRLKFDSSGRPVGREARTNWRLSDDMISLLLCWIRERLYYALSLEKGRPLDGRHTKSKKSRDVRSAVPFFSGAGG